MDNIRIKHEKFLIRALEERDLKEYISILKEPSFYRYMDVKAIATIPYDVAYQRLKPICAEYKSIEDENESRFVIQDIKTNDLIGGLVVQHPILDSIEIGWYIRSKYSGNNFGCLACKLLISYIFDNMRGINVIKAEIQQENKKSIHVAKKIGFKESGRYMGKCTVNIVYKIWRNDWYATSGV